MIDRFKELIDFYFVILTLLVAFVLFFMDSINLDKKGLKKEKKIAIALSVIMLIMGPFLYILSIVL
ncbi:MAG: CLC_0170 family protein [Senegalia sp. (in: firmicutes)]|uniref:CLC_0170 family protein n=1 Tax=Senegalia sp. (in: firmicutes) TaxID=1924098 RepID=UPI003F96C067